MKKLTMLGGSPIPYPLSPKFALCALALIVFMGVSCTAPINDDPGTEASSIAAKNGDPVTVRVSLPSAEMNRSISDENQLKAQVKYWEVYFRDQDASATPKYSVGSGEIDQGGISVQVTAGHKYDVLLIGGIKEGRVLLASSYVADCDIIAGQKNVIPLPEPKLIQLDPTNIAHFKFEYQGITSKAFRQNGVAYIQMRNPIETSLKTTITVGTIEYLMKAAQEGTATNTEANDKFKANLASKLFLVPTDANNFYVEKAEDPKGDLIKKALADLKTSYGDLNTSLSTATTGLKDLLGTLETSLKTGSGGDAFYNINSTYPGSRSSLVDAEDAVTAALTLIGASNTDPGKVLKLVNDAYTLVDTANTAVGGLVPTADFNDVKAEVSGTSKIIVSAGTPNTAIGDANAIMRDTATNNIIALCEAAFTSIRKALNNIKSGSAFDSSVSAAWTAYDKAFAQFQEVKKYYENTLTDYNNLENSIEPVTVTTAFADTTIKSEYTIPKKSLPGGNLTGKLYFEIQYTAFSDEATGKKWRIRNGFNNNQDTAGGAGGAILLVIGGAEVPAGDTTMTINPGWGW